MPAVNRYYSSTAVDTTLTGPITNVATSMVVASVSGWPTSYPYTVILDEGTATEEIVSVTAAAGTTLTVTRAQDGTSGVAHSTGATARHGVSARDFKEPQDHIAGNSGVHGVNGNVIGATDTQTLTNKDLTSSTNTFPSSLATLTGTQTLSGKTLSDAIAQASATTTKALLVKPQASPTANVLEVQDGSSNIAARIYKGVLFFTTELNTILNVNAGVNSVNAAGLTSIVPVVAQGATGQTANLQEWRDPTGSVLAFLSPLGRISNFRTGGGNILAAQGDANGYTLYTESIAAGQVAHFIKAASGQTASLTSWTDSTGAVLMSVDSGGRLVNKIPAVSSVVTTSVTGVAGTEATLATLSAITADGTAKVRVDFSWSNMSCATAGQVWEVRIKDGATVVHTVRIINQTASTSEAGGHAMVVLTPTAGSHTYSAVAIRISGTATGTWGAASTGPMTLSCQQLI